MSHIFKVLVVWILFAQALLPWHCYGQETAQPLFSQEQIEQLVAPIALYPDPLLAQILMASTYPLDIVSAARWVRAHPNLKGKALQDALQQQPWDDSVKSLTAVPQVLNMLNDKLDMTQKLGDAFLAQQKQVMDAVQKLRAEAQAKGNLKTTKQQVITTTQVSGSPVVVIEPADPQVIYVPSYDPNYVYGAWPYPAYPPYYYYPPGYIAGTALLSFGLGLAVGNALWGNFNWHNGNVYINANRYNNFYGTHITNGNWQHNPAHRRGVPYRDAATQQRYGRGQLQGAQARDAFRGRAEQGRQELNRGNVNTARPNNRPNNAHTNPSRNVRQRSNASHQQHAVSRQSHPARNVSGERRQGAFEGINRGAESRNFSNRGRASHASAVSRGGFSGGHRGGGGGHRGGGGGGHRGGGGRHR